MTELSLVEAVRLALDRAMSEDERLVVLGEDVGINGGVFRATDGLWQRFGGERVRDTPLSETAIAGVAIGLAAQGFRPVAEIQFMGFVYSALDQIVNHASRLRSRTRGRLTCPLVMRMPYGGGIHAPEHHSESTEALLTHIPGLRVVVPSSPQRACGLLRSAIRDPDPVIFLEPKRLYRSAKEPVDVNLEVPLDRAFVLREGKDLTIIAWGAMIPRCLTVAEQLQTEGIESEVIDVATLKPLDIATISESVQKTGRCVIVHEAARTNGYGAEIATRITESAFFSLLAPVARVTGYDTIMPLPRLEGLYMPDVSRILTQARETLSLS